MEIITKSTQETYELGKRFGASVASAEYTAQSAKVFALSGELGSGKTTFLQGFAKGLGIKQRIISPTFILMRQYGNFYHVDLYRLEGNLEKEVRSLGLMGIWEKRGNIVAIEWAEKIADLIPKGATWIKFENLGENERKITVI